MARLRAKSSMRRICKFIPRVLGGWGTRHTEIHEAFSSLYGRGLEIRSFSQYNIAKGSEVDFSTSDFASCSFQGSGVAERAVFSCSGPSLCPSSLGRHHAWGLRGAQLRNPQRVHSNHKLAASFRLEETLISVGGLLNVCSGSLCKIFQIHSRESF